MLGHAASMPMHGLSIEMPAAVNACEAGSSTLTAMGCYFRFFNAITTVVTIKPRLDKRGERILGFTRQGWNNYIRK